MRFDYWFAIEEYKKVEKYLEKYGYRCEVTGSLRRRKEDVGDIDIVVGNQLSLSVRSESKENLEEIEQEILKLVSKYSEIKRLINHYEFLLKSGISIHIIPELSKYFNYTLWHSTGPKPHVKLIKKIYKENGIEMDMENTLENKIYENINLEYLQPEKRWKLE